MKQATEVRCRLPDICKTKSLYEASIERTSNLEQVKVTIFSISRESQDVLESNSTYLDTPCKLEPLSEFMKVTRAEFETFRELNDKHIVYLFNAMDKEPTHPSTFGKVFIDGGWWLTINGCPAERFSSEGNIDAIVQQEKQLEALISNAELVVEQLRTSGFEQENMKPTAAKFFLINAISNAKQSMVAPCFNDSYSGQLYTYKSN